MTGMPDFTRYLTLLNAIKVEDPEGMRKLIDFSRHISKGDLTQEQHEELFKLINEKAEHAFEALRKERKQHLS